MEPGLTLGFRGHIRCQTSQPTAIPTASTAAMLPSLGNQRFGRGGFCSRAQNPSASTVAAATTGASRARRTDAAGTIPALMDSGSAVPDLATPSGPARIDPPPKGSNTGPTVLTGATNR